MAALLTSVLDSSTKVAEYIAECKELGISILPPDVNESDANFTVAGENIRFGLVAIKGIGWGAIQGLTADREKNGPFQDFEDFCRRMAGGELNKRAVENLIRAGAFDSMGYKRRALLQVYEAVLDGITRSQRDNISGQMDLFGLDGESEAVPTGFTLPELEEYPKRDLMAMEKETTGLYFSGHPMDEYRGKLGRLGVAPIGAILSDFEAEDGPRRFADGQTVTVAGIVETLRARPTKNGTLMNYVMLEDDSGTIELIVFQRAMDQGGVFLKENAALFIRGRISVRDEKEPQIMVDSIRPLSEVDGAAPPAPQTTRTAPPSRETQQKEQKLYVKLPSRFDPALKRIELILTMFPGRQQMVIWCEREQQRIGARCLIHEGLILELREMLGEENVVLR